MSRDVASSVNVVLFCIMLATVQLCVANVAHYRGLVKAGHANRHSYLSFSYDQHTDQTPLTFGYVR